MPAKAGSPAAVMSFLRKHFSDHPDEAAPLMLAVQAGNFKAETKQLQVWLACKTMDKLPPEFMVSSIVEWVPSLSFKLMSKVQGAVYENGAKDDQILNKMWLALTGATAGEPIPSKSRQLCSEILTSVREGFPVAPTISIGSDFKIKFNVYVLSGKEDMAGGRKKWTTLKHAWMDTTVPHMKSGRDDQPKS